MSGPPPDGAGHHLLTCFCTVVCYDLAQRKLVHVPPGARHDGLQAVTVRHDVATGRLAMMRYGPPGAFARTRTAAVRPALPQFGPFAVEPARSDKLVHLRASERLLCADSAGNVRLWSQAPGAWETFLLVTPQDLADLDFLQRHSWVSGSGAQLVRPDAITLGRDFTLRFGPHRVALAANLPLPFRTEMRGGAGFTRASFYIDGWKIEEITLYRPLIYYVAFGNENVLRLLETSLATLDQLAGYDGAILLITDRTAAQLATLIPPRLARLVHIWNVQGDDRADYAAARYLVPHWPGAGAYQPLLYTDTDVCFERDLTPMFVRLLHYPKLSAQRETFSRLRNTESVGAELLREDDCDVGETYGFCAGIIGIPSVASHGEALLKVAETMYRLAAARDNRRPLSWFDQSVANYVGFKTGSFDPDLLSEYVRHGDGQDGQPPTGLLHVWGAGGLKLEKMRRYLAGRLAEMPAPG